MENKTNSQLNIIQFCDNFYPQIDGVVKVVDNTTKILNECNNAKVVVPKYKGKNFDDSIFNYEVLRKNSSSININGFEIPFPRKTKGLTDLIKDFKPDIFHVHSPFFMAKYALKLAKRLRIPVVGTFHSQYKKDILSVTNSNLIANVMVKKIVKVFNQFDEVWAPSNSTADVLRSYGYKKDIFIMENGTDFSYPVDIDSLVKRAKQEFNIKDCNKNLLFVGQLRDVKNIPLILRTLKKLLDVDKSYHLYIVGEGSDRAKYEKWIINNGIQDYVHFIGKVTDRNILAGIYASCDLFFFPSTYDNAPIVVRESSVMKTPVLLPKGSVASEPFTDGVNGFLAEENDEKMREKIINVFRSPDEMKKIGQRASIDIPISYEKMAFNTLERYNYLIQRFRSER